VIIKVNEHEIDTGERPVDSIEVEIETHDDDDGIRHMETSIRIDYADPPGAVEGDLTVYGAVHARAFEVGVPEVIGGPTLVQSRGLAALRDTARPERVRLDPGVEG
jgi:hypothetical protein